MTLLGKFKLQHFKLLLVSELQILAFPVALDQVRPDKNDFISAVAEVANVVLLHPKEDAQTQVEHALKQTLTNNALVILVSTADTAEVI